MNMLGLVLKSHFRFTRSCISDNELPDGAYPCSG